MRGFSAFQALFASLLIPFFALGLTLLMPFSASAAPEVIAPDAIHHVLIVPEADLVIIFPRTNTGPVEVYYEPGEASFVTTHKPLKSFRLFEDLTTRDTRKPSSDLAVECFRGSSIPFDPARLFSREFLGKYPDLKPVEVERLTMAAYLGMSHAVIDNVTDYRVFRASGVSVWLWKTKSYTYLYTLKRVATVPGEDPSSPIEALGVETRLASLVKATQDVTLKNPQNLQKKW